MQDGLQLFEKIWHNEIPSQQILKALLYFNDGDLMRLSLEDKKILNNEVKKLQKLLFNSGSLKGIE